MIDLDLHLHLPHRCEMYPFQHVAEMVSKISIVIAAILWLLGDIAWSFIGFGVSLLMTCYASYMFWQSAGGERRWSKWVREHHHHPDVREAAHRG